MRREPVPRQLIRSCPDPEPSSLSSEGSIPQWRREEIRALPQELLAQCLLTMQARERQALEIRTQSLLTSPDEKATAARSVGGLDDTVGGFAKQERVRQMQTLMVMWSRGCVFFFVRGSRCHSFG